jgi:Protein of unknown function (DUF3995)
MIRNVHSRRFMVTAEQLGRVFDTLAGDNDLVWPAWRWEPLRMDNGLQVGSAGGHGSIRYRVESYVPGRSVVFRFDDNVGIVGTHSFRVEPAVDDPNAATITHELLGEATGQMKTLWPLLVEKLHDATIEDSFDTVAVAVDDHSQPVRRVSFIERQFHAIINRSPAATSKPIRIAGDLTAAGLLAAGAIHAAWGAGLYWPGTDSITLAQRVVGGSVFPAPRDCFLVAGVLTAAAGLLAVRTHAKPKWEISSVGPLSGLGVAGLGIILAARGSLGLLASATGIPQTTGVFRRLNALIYSPLCLLLAAGAFLVNGMLSKPRVHNTGKSGWSNASPAAS